MNLPEELYLWILGYLDFRDLLKCSEVCWTFKNLIENTSSFQYTIELAVCGQLDNQDCALTPSQKLERLREHKKAWRDLKWSREYTIPIADGRAWNLRGGVLGHLTTQRTMIFYKLASDLRDIQAHTWTVEFEPEISNPDDFSLDPSQDLLVVFESGQWQAHQANFTDTSVIHLRSLSTGRPHPNACLEEIPVEVARGHPSQCAELQILGSLVLLYFRVRPISQVIIWDWKTGEMVYGLESYNLLDASLLSRHWLLLGTVDSGNISLHVVDLCNATSQGNAIIESKLTLRYPDLLESSLLNGLAFYCSPSRSLQPSPTSPFFTDSHDFLIVVSLNILQNNDVGHVCTHTIPASHLICLAESHAFKSTKFWEEWASNKTSLIRSSSQQVLRHGANFIHGPRFVLTSDGSSGLVVDFNQLDLRRKDQKSTQDDKEVQLSQDISMLFHLPLVAPLPHRTAITKLPISSPFSFFLFFSEDNLVIADLQNHIYRILVF